MADNRAEMGLIGLGEMGRNLVLNMADHGYSVAVYNRTLEKTREFMEKEAGSRPIRPGTSPAEFVGLLRRPRAIVLMISAGRAVDEMIGELLPLLEPNDLIIDAGNSFFPDTDRREQILNEKGFLYMGLGISGGGSGARFGPSLMPGGSPQAYERVGPVFEAIAARVNGSACVAHLGKGSAGHYVKMVHNGIEYGLMQLIAESYHLLKQGLGLNDDEISRTFARWNQTELQSYLLEITARIFLQEDDRGPGRLIDSILDQAGQKGTGLWTSANALELQVPIPTIDLAEMMRDLSGYGQARQTLGRIFGGSTPLFHGDPEGFISCLGRALYGGMILTYCQGLALLQKASQIYQYGLQLAEVARIWRGGCIIRAALLEKIMTAYRIQSDLPLLLMDPDLEETFKSCQQDLRSTIKTAVDLGIPLPGLMASLLYYDSFRSKWLPANLIQAQRDYFGAHTYQRLDAPGVFHTDWERNEKRL
jgi:6-phosphogluconate dehydrogenase